MTRHACFSSHISRICAYHLTIVKKFPEDPVPTVEFPCRMIRDSTGIIMDGREGVVIRVDERLKLMLGDRRFSRTLGASGGRSVSSEEESYIFLVLDNAEGAQMLVTQSMFYRR